MQCLHIQIYSTPTLLNVCHACLPCICLTEIAHSINLMHIIEKQRGASHLHMMPTSRITATTHHSRRSAEAEVDKGVPGLAGPVSTSMPSSETNALGAGVYVCVAFKAVLLSPPMITCIFHDYMCLQDDVMYDGEKLRLQSTQVEL